MTKRRNKLNKFLIMAIIVLFATIGFVYPVSAESISVSNEELVDVLNRVVLALEGTEEGMLGGTTNYDTLGVDDIYLNGTDGYVNFSITEGETGYGIRNNSGTMQSKNDGGTWATLGATTPGDEGWIAYEPIMTPATNVQGYRYALILGGSNTATSSITNADETTVLAADGGVVVTGTLDVAGAVSLDGGAFIFNDSGADLDFTIEGDTDTSLFVADASGDKVGISISVPTYTLDVGGDIGMDDKLYHNDDTDSYLTWDANDSWSLFVGAEEMINITEDGSQDIFEIGDGGDMDIDLNDDMFILGSNSSVGIGVIDPDAFLEVFGTTKQLKLSYDGSNECSWTVDGSGDLIRDCSGNNVSYAADNIVTTGNFSAANITGSGNLIIDTNTLYVDSSANSVGIGTTTPGTRNAELTVAGQIDLVDATSPNDLLVRIYDFADGDDGAIDLLANTATTTRINANGSSYFTGGEVGFGTTTPSSSYAVDVYGNLRVGEEASASAFLVDGGTQVASFGGALTVTGTLAQVGASTFTGAATFNGSALIGINGALDAAAGTALSIGTSTATSILIGDTGVDTTLYGGLTVTQATILTGAATLSSTLGVTGVVTLTTDLLVDTDTLFVDASANNVGIGTSTPQVSLVIDEGTTATSTLGIGDKYSGTGKGCIEMPNSEGTASRMYIDAAGTALVVEAGSCE